MKTHNYDNRFSDLLFQLKFKSPTLKKSKWLLYIIVLCLVCFLDGYCQTIKDNWHYGKYVGLNMSGAPSVLTGPVNNASIFSEGGAGFTYTDPISGNIVFYTDGDKIWDFNDAQIGNGLFPIPPFAGSPSCISGAPDSYVGSPQHIIGVPTPGSVPGSQEFIMFGSIVISFGTYDFYWRSITIQPGSVVMGPLNMISSQNHCSALNIIPHCNGIDYWLITTRYFSAYEVESRLVSSYGVSNIPNTFSLGSGYIFNGEHQLKCSPNNRHIAISSNYAVVPNPPFNPQPLMTINFDNSYGTFASLQSYLPSPGNGGFHGISFSSNSQYVYASEQGSIKQVDLGSAAMSTVNAGGSSFWRFYSMQLAPDGNIYMIEHGSSGTNPYELSFISNADTPSPFLNLNAININAQACIENSYASDGFPNLMDGTVMPASVFSFTTTNVSCMIKSITVNPCWAGYHYLIDWGDGTTSFSTTPPYNLNHLYATTGTYTITVTLLNPDPSNNASTPIPSNPIQATQTVTAGSINATLSLNACQTLITAQPSGAGYTYSWNGGPSTTSNTFNVSTAGTYSVTVTDSSGCTGTASITATPFTVTIIGSSTACIGTPASYSTQYYSGAIYTWTISNPSVGTLSYPLFPNYSVLNVNWNTAGTFIVSVTVTYNGCTTKTVFVVTVQNCCLPITICGLNYAVPLTEALWIANCSTPTSLVPTTTISPGLIVKLDADPANGYVQLNPGFMASMNASGMFVAQAFNACLPGAPLKPIDGDDATIVGVAGLSLEEFKVYPNPTSNIINIVHDGLSNEKINIEVFSLDGKPLYRRLDEIFNGNTELDLSTFPNGIYILKINNTKLSKTMRVQKIN
jgi:hypothetical protein